MSTNLTSIIIDGIRYVPEGSTPVPDRISVFYMHDNHTFTRLTGSLVEIVQLARACAITSHYGMLCDAILLRGDDEIRRVGGCVHATKTLGDTSKWEEALRADTDVMRLLSRL